MMVNPLLVAHTPFGPKLLSLELGSQQAINEHQTNKKGHGSAHGIMLNIIEDHVPTMPVTKYLEMIISNCSSNLQPNQQYKQLAKALSETLDPTKILIAGIIHFQLVDFLVN